MDRAPSAHTVKSFDDEIHQLRSLIGQMGGLAEAQTTDAVSALVRRDIDAALEVVAKDAEIDTLEAMLVQSATDQQEVTDRLGLQVRRKRRASQAHGNINLIALKIR